jgi:hypothetical protein
MINQCRVFDGRESMNNSQNIRLKKKVNGEKEKWILKKMAFSMRRTT